MPDRPVRPREFHVLSSAVIAPLAAMLVLASFCIFPPRRTSLLLAQLPHSRHPSFQPVSLLEESPRIGLTPGGLLYVNDHPIPKELLPILLKRTPNLKQTVVFTGADRRTRWRDVKAVLRAARRVKFSRVFLLTTFVNRNGRPVARALADAFKLMRQEGQHEQLNQ
ncbi:MAG: hypothetical protein P8Z49_03860 [Acidobacteriota bacterium]